nr:hypothetical protein B0A51_02210 [Rachicladosporium sp. CCFEE 5018]
MALFRGALLPNFETAGELAEEMFTAFTAGGQHQNQIEHGAKDDDEVKSSSTEEVEETMEPGTAFEQQSAGAMSNDTVLGRIDNDTNSTSLSTNLQQRTTIAPNGGLMVELGQIKLDAPSPSEVHNIVAVGREWHLPHEYHGATMKTVKLLWARKDFDPDQKLPALTAVLDAISLHADVQDRNDWTPPQPEPGCERISQEGIIVKAKDLSQHDLIMVLLADIAVVIARDGSFQLGDVVGMGRF